MRQAGKSTDKSRQHAILFDLDRTLINSVYEHVLAWREALEYLDIELSTWFVHRRIGMSGGMIVHAFQREAGRTLGPREVAHLGKLHAAAYKKRSGQVRLLPGARDLLRDLSRLKVRWAIATSGKREGAQPFLKMLGVGPSVPVITRDEVQHAKPDPDLFQAAAGKLGVPLERCIVVGDSVWDLLAAQRARALGVGLLSGGFGQDELERAGAYRVYRDPADLLAHLDEVGIRVETSQ